MTLQQINQLNFEDVLLQKLGIAPKIRRRNSLFYISPLRPNEKTPSFHITKMNPYDLYFDHGNGVGGKIVDFFMEYLNVDSKGVFEYFNENYFSFQKPKVLQLKYDGLHDGKYEITKIQSLESSLLIQYLKTRKISLEIANRYCKEIHYTLNGRSYFAIGFPTENGFEIRNKYIKMCLNGKGITSILNGNLNVKVFESWSDFLSFLTMFPDQEFKSDFLVLNSVSLLKKKIELLEKYQKIEAFLDVDSAGKSSMKLLEQHFGSRCVDASHLYKTHKDLNDFLIHTKTQRKKM